LILGLIFVTAVEAADPCRSGLQAGQRPGPYAFLVATGTNRGTSHCFVCDTGDKPAVIVFARTLNDPLGRLLLQLDQTVAKQKDADLRAWATFLAEDQPALDPQLVNWSRKHGLSNLPIGVFEDLNGPPSYRLSSDADVTVLLAVNQKVVANFAFRTGELTDDKIKEIIAEVPRLLPEKR
jgi:hypothetical protein